MKNSSQVKLKGKLKTYMQWPLYIGILMVAMTLGMLYVDPKLGVAMSGFTAIYLVVYLILVFHMKPSIMRSIVDFAVGYSQIQKEMLKELEIPYGILDSDGKFMWVNNSLDVLLDHENVSGKLITSVFSQIPTEVIPEIEGNNSIRIRHNDRDYRVELKSVDITELVELSDVLDGEEKNYIISVYMFDETEMNEYIQHINDERFVAGLIYIDNYDEALESVEEVRRSLLVGLVDRKVNKCFSQLGGIVKKLEKDKYLVTIRYKALVQLEENKFPILDEVKAISIGNEMPVTISVGIGACESTYLENYELARSAIEFALARGGDQCVVKDGDKVTYFGGKSQSQEKNTRVKARVKAQALKEIMETKDKVIIMGHALGDVDSFGASIGIYRAAKALNKRAYVVADNITVSVKPLRDKFKNSADYEKDMIVNGNEALELLDNNTVVVVVDVNSPSRTECPALLDKCKTKVVIDHHRQGSEAIEGAVLSYIEPFASSACEMVAEILQYVKEGLKVKTLEADVMYAGMIIDTNNFTNKAGVRTFEAAAYLKRCGTDTVRVRKLLRNDMRDYKARAEAISRVTLFNEGFAITTCNGEGTESPTVVAAKVANELLDINGIKASFVLTSYEEVIYVSARSIDDINVQLIMEKIGGGGHMNVAGAQLKNMSMEEALRLVRGTVDELLENKEI